MFIPVAIVDRLSRRVRRYTRHSAATSEHSGEALESSLDQVPNLLHISDDGEPDEDGELEEDEDKAEEEGEGQRREREREMQLERERQRQRPPSTSSLLESSELVMPHSGGDQDEGQSATRVHHVYMATQAMPQDYPRPVQSPLYGKLRFLQLEEGDHVRVYGLLEASDPALYVCSVLRQRHTRVGVFPGALLQSLRTQAAAVPRTPDLHKLRLLNTKHCQFELLWQKASRKPYLRFDRPRLPAGFFLLGDRCTQIFSKASRVATISNMIAVAEHPSLTAHPLDYDLLWSDRKGFALWAPVPPVGFYALGMVISPSASEKPELARVLCLSASCTGHSQMPVDIDLAEWTITGRSRGKPLFVVPSRASIFDLDAQTRTRVSPGTFWASLTGEFEHRTFRDISIDVVDTIRYYDEELGFLTGSSRIFDCMTPDSAELPVCSRLHMELLAGRQKMQRNYIHRVYRQLSHLGCQFWTEQELIFLFREFETISRNGYLSTHTRRFLTDEGQELFRGIMIMCDRDRNGAVDFFEFSLFLGTIIRGSVDQRSELTFRCLDTEGIGIVDPLSVESLLIELANIAPRIITPQTIPHVRQNEIDDLLGLVHEYVQLIQQSRQHAPTGFTASSAGSNHLDSTQAASSTSNLSLTGLASSPSSASTSTLTPHPCSEFFEDSLEADEDDSVGQDLSTSASSSTSSHPTESLTSKHVGGALVFNDSTPKIPFRQMQVELNFGDVCTVFTPYQPSDQKLPELSLHRVITTTASPWRLDLGGWQARLAVTPALADCFGLFRAFYLLFVLPMEVELYSTFFQRTFFAGTLNLGQHFVLHHRFLAEFSQNEEGTLAEHPNRVYNLSGASVRAQGRLIILETVNPHRIVPLTAPKSALAKAWHHMIVYNSQALFPFRSFAAPRFLDLARYFITASGYFEALLEAISRAQHRIYIVGWALAPGLYLTRGNGQADAHNRLDRVLQRTAARGVHIYVLVWHASPVAMKTLDINFTLNFLPSLHPNIHLQSHPFGVKTMYSLWTHHQKFCVIDEEMCFVGGIDLCYGRYDTNDHLITDVDGIFFPGRDYMNYNFIPDTNGPTRQSQMPRNRLPRMGWEDIHCQMTGKSAGDVSINFIERWNWVRYESRKRQIAKQIPSLFPLNPSRTQLHSAFIDQLRSIPLPGSIADPGPLQPVQKVQILRSVCSWSIGSSSTTECSIYLAYLHAIQAAQRLIYIENQYFISSNLTQNKIADALFNRISLAIRNRQLFRTIVVLPIYPATPAPIITRYIHWHHLKSICKGKKSLVGRLETQFPGGIWKRYLGFFCLRTHAFWNPRQFYQAPFPHDPQLLSDEGSCLPAIDCLEDLEGHSPSVEDAPDCQFGVPVSINFPHHQPLIKTVHIGPEDTWPMILQQLVSKVGLHNPDAAALMDASGVFSYECSSSAGYLWQEFDPRTSPSAALPQLVALRDAHPGQPLRLFLGLPRFPVTEQIYVHTKLMIVDDRLLILGSANINDRSLLGCRDSEIGMVIRDFDAEGSIGTLRRRLFCKFLGLSYPEQVDAVYNPCSPEFWDLWKGTAQQNGRIYSDVFPSIFESLGTWPSSPAEANHHHRPEHISRLKDIRGFLINYPSRAARKENLKPPALSPESILPMVLFT